VRRDKSGESRVYIRMTGVTRRKITVREDIRGTIKRSSLPFYKIESKHTSFIHLGIFRAIAVHRTSRIKSSINVQRAESLICREYQSSHRNLVPSALQIEVQGNKWVSLTVGTSFANQPLRQNSLSGIPQLCLFEDCDVLGDLKPELLE